LVPQCDRRTTLQLRASSRERFVADLAYLGVEEVNDDGEAVLLRD
jgi:hypothetical protein